MCFYLRLSNKVEYWSGKTIRNFTTFVPKHENIFIANFFYRTAVAGSYVLKVHQRAFGAAGDLPSSWYLIKWNSGCNFKLLHSMNQIKSKIFRTSFPFSDFIRNVAYFPGVGGRFFVTFNLQQKIKMRCIYLTGK